MPPHRFIIRQYPEDTADDGPEHQCLSEVRGECFAMFCCEVGRPCGLLVSGVFKDGHISMSFTCSLRLRGASLLSDASILFGIF